MPWWDSPATHTELAKKNVPFLSSMVAMYVCKVPKYYPAKSDMLWLPSLHHSFQAFSFHSNHNTRIGEIAALHVTMTLVFHKRHRKKRAMRRGYVPMYGGSQDLHRAGPHSRTQSGVALRLGEFFVLLLRVFHCL